MITNILKYPGAKWRIAEWIISKMPVHRSYVEPFFGSGAVFFRKAPSAIETINDVDNDVVNLFRVVRDAPEKLIEKIEFTPFARQEYEHAFSTASEEPIEKARLFLIRCWQGHGFRTDGSKAGWKVDIQGRESAYALRNWTRLPDWINNIVDRLKLAQIENRPAVDVIKRWNFENVLIYADPPYVLSTRSRKIYNHEMSDADHAELLRALKQHTGPVMISGYDNELYNDLLQGWTKYKTENLAENGLHRTDVLWANREENQIALF